MCIPCVGEKFGDLVVVEESPRRGKHRYARCRCSCGNDKVVKLSHLRGGLIRSCGHLREVDRGGEPPPPVRDAQWLPLGDGKWTLVDPDIAERFRSVKLHHNVGYAYFSVRRDKWDYASVPLHREIMGVADVPVSEIEVDHANGNRADNRRANLRLCSRAENSRNMPARSVSGFKGVTKNKHRWYALIQVDGVTHRLGSFTDPVIAARAYDEAAKRLHGEFAKLNFP